MKTIKLEAGHLYSFSDVKNINEEVQAILLPLITAVENEAESDTYFMVKAIRRLMNNQFDTLSRLEEVIK
ncbi:hypothetical protein [Morganella psychrotolerans]|uniref:Uncharacterized protein n=1 Tax=Morganella psychrotolerans TaxID=368603 RepID=A0A1B8HMU9_9GAMM|nr:hypothetical protein [Morganella psychrotolerans]OBU10773.1 hypothetical protein AYY17_14740 [Morganella psychrotolerans]